MQGSRFAAGSSSRYCSRPEDNKRTKDGSLPLPQGFLMQHQANLHMMTLAGRGSSSRDSLRHSTGSLARACLDQCPVAILVRGMGQVEPCVSPASCSNSSSKPGPSACHHPSPGQPCMGLGGQQRHGDHLNISMPDNKNAVSMNNHSQVPQRKQTLGLWSSKAEVVALSVPPTRQRHCIGCWH